MQIEIYKLHFLMGTYKKFYDIEVESLPVVGEIINIPQHKDCVMVRNVDGNKIFTEAAEKEGENSFCSMFPIDKDNWKIVQEYRE